MLTRREFSRNFLAGGTALLASDSLWTAAKPPVRSVQSSPPDCDLLIKGGTVIDPSQHLHAVLDVAVKNGKILEVSRDFPEGRASTVVPAKDKIVTPGFVDIFAHVFDGVTRNAMNADLDCLVKGTTTAV